VITAAHDHRAAPATLRLHRDVPIPRRAQDRVRRSQTRWRPRPRQHDNLARSLSKNPALASSPKHRATPRGMSLTGRLEDDQLRLHRLEGGKLLSNRLGDGPCYCPASRDARAVMRLTAPSPPATPDGAHEAIRVDFALYGSEDLCSMDTRLDATRPAHVLALRARDGRPGRQATCTK
jgi:hypothetical protein